MAAPTWPLTFSYISPQDLREKNWKAMEALASAERACEEKLRSLIQAKVRVLCAWSDLLVWQTTWNAQTMHEQPWPWSL